MSDLNKVYDAVFKIGSLAGLASFFWLAIKDMIDFCRKPRLEITFKKDLDLRTFTFQDTGWKRKFATLHVKNKRNMTAKRCVAVLKIVGKPPESDNIENQYALHWAGVDYSTLTTGAQPIDLGPEPIRLDVLFTQEGQTINGSWIAVPFALSGNLLHNQAHLVPGEYEVEIAVTCENGSGDKAKFKIRSPISWNELDMNRS